MERIELSSSDNEVGHATEEMALEGLERKLQEYKSKVRILQEQVEKKKAEKAQIDAKSIAVTKIKAHLDSHLNLEGESVDTCRIASELVTEGFTTAAKISLVETPDVRMLNVAPRLPLLLCKNIVKCLKNFYDE